MRAPRNEVAVRGTLDGAIREAARWGLSHQKEAGYWVGRVCTNACMEAEWLMAFHVLGIEHPHIDGLQRALFAEQRDDGSWETYHQAPKGDINTTVECYAALRVHGVPADDPRLVRAREWIFADGGLREVRVFTRYWLALLGEWPWRQTPNVPPEILFVPKGAPFNVYRFASWARATLVPIAILSARRHCVPLPAERRLNELFPEGRERFDFSLPTEDGWIERGFWWADRAMHSLQERSWMPLRETAIQKAIAWIVARQDADGVWGGIQPPWIYSMLALHCEGFDPTHPVLAQGLAALEDPRWLVKVEDRRYVQASVSPVWDTELMLLGLIENGYADERVERGVQWLLSQQVDAPGDWAKSTDVEPGGWAFEYENRSYPDVDDTSVALLVLAHAKSALPAQRPSIERSIARAMPWMLAMQSRDGGWGAFDRDNDDALITKIPFADFGEVLDPPTVDVTAHVIEAMAELGYSQHHPSLRRAHRFVRDRQESDGSWFGRWGVNHIYGTSAVLPALSKLGENMRQPYLRRAARWLVDHQNRDGGWGESCASYMDTDYRGRGPSTASQTAWALIALCACDHDDDAASIEAGVRYLIDNQQEGTWVEPYFTGTGFPGYGFGDRIELNGSRASGRQGSELARGFMLRYELYRHYFPMIGLARAERYLQKRAVGEISRQLVG
ncbi:MAG: squalene--hopene cyclase [Myxococcota bacterium]